MRYSEKEYAEVYEVIKQDKGFQKKIPQDVLTHIKSKAKRAKFEIQYQQEEELLAQISRNSLLLLIYLYLKYDGEDNKIKQEMKELLVGNEMKKRV